MRTGLNKEKQSLTQRQQQVVALVGQGLTNKEIASQLGISEGTVKQHIFAIFRELNLSSRSKLALVGQKMGAKFQSQLDKNAGLRQILTGTFSWRLIATVAVSFAAPPADQPSVLVQRNKMISQSREAMGPLLEALDGKSIILPDGGLLAWFGHPVSHIDDPDRASFFAQSFYAYLQEKKLPIAFGLGIATHAEVVPADTEQLSTTKAFQEALALASKSMQSGLVLANSLTQRLAPASVPWLELKPKDQDVRNGTPQTVKEHLYAIHPKPDQVALNSTSFWGALPFLDEIFIAVQSGLAHWVAVESWPPSMATSLMDAIGKKAKQAGFQSLRLHLTSAKQAEQTVRSLLTQVECYVNSMEARDSNALDPVLQFINVLSELSSKTPLCVQIYGLKSLVTMRDILGSRGIDRLISQKVLLVTSNLGEIQNPKTSIRVLGPRPLDAIFNRVYILDEPSIDLMPGGVMVDMQAMFDDLSPLARHIALLVAQAPKMTTDHLSAQLKVPRPLVQNSLRELRESGLVFLQDDGAIEFRDSFTAKAITQLIQLVD